MFFDFTHLLEHAGVATNRTRLLRHDDRGIAAWAESKERFGCFASFQMRDRSPYNNADLALHFLPGPKLSDGSLSARFICGTTVRGRWDWNGTRKPNFFNEREIARETIYTGRVVYDLDWWPEFDGLSDRLIIRWGESSSTRAWSQWADKQRKEIVELRRDSDDPPFPGFADFSVRLSGVPSLFRSWRKVLSEVGGVYLLVRDDGLQYVGAAYGVGGFAARWDAHAKKGGDAKKLSSSYDYTISILEISDLNLIENQALDLEEKWKTKLGSRAHGLNAN